MDDQQPRGSHPSVPFLSVPVGGWRQVPFQRVDLQDDSQVQPYCVRPREPVSVFVVDVLVPHRRRNPRCAQSVADLGLSD